MKKNKISKLFWALIALVSYAISSEVAAQGIINPLPNERIHFIPKSDSNRVLSVVLFKGYVFGNGETDPNKLALLKKSKVHFNPIGSIGRVENVTILYKTNAETQKEKIVIDSLGLSNTPLNFPLFVTPYEVTIIGDINTENLPFGDVLSIDASFTIGKDWETGKTFQAETQYVAYAGTTSVNSFDQNKINVYPNPFTNVINLNNFTEVIQQVTLTNVLGQTIYSVYSPLNSSIETSGLTAGTYILSVYTKSKTYAYNLIKN